MMTRRNFVFLSLIGSLRRGKENLEKSVEKRQGLKLRGEGQKEGEISLLENCSRLPSQLLQDEANNRIQGHNALRKISKDSSLPVPRMSNRPSPTPDPDPVKFSPVWPSEALQTSSSFVSLPGSGEILEKAANLPPLG